MQGRFAVGLDLRDDALDGAGDGDDVAYTILGVLSLTELQYNVHMHQE